MAKKKNKTLGIGTTVWKKCHTGAVPIIVNSATGTHFYVGGESRDILKDIKPGSLEISLLERATGSKQHGLPKPSGLTEVARQFFARILALPFDEPEEKEPQGYHILHLPIKDFAAPVYKAEVWVALAEDITAALRDGKNVYMYCMGGHGRTGTAAAILAPLICKNNAIFDPDPITWLREKYCEEVVESSKQVEYVFDILAELGYGDLVPPKEEWPSGAKTYESYNAETPYYGLYQGESYKPYNPKDNGATSDTSDDDGTVIVEGETAPSLVSKSNPPKCASCNFNIAEYGAMATEGTWEIVPVCRSCETFIKEFRCPLCKKTVPRIATGTLHSEIYDDYEIIVCHDCLDEDVPPHRLVVLEDTYDFSQNQSE